LRGVPFPFVGMNGILWKNGDNTNNFRGYDVV